ncbi:MAG: T9SS type A sorting domain-containing protein [Bacteroidetes bacterium]|nr:T9SS type A sorting domain-containing protein [Bacteroidota bacterium]
MQVILTSSSTQTITQCKEYVFGGQTYTNSGTYLDTFINMYGCDSIVTLNLTINGPTVNVTQAGITLTAVAPSPATYQWINCTTGNTPIMGATSQSYTATSNGSYAVAVSLNGCTDTSACKLVNGVGIDDQYAEMLIKVYPNPVNENLFVNLNMTIQDASISVKNIVGQELITMSNMDLRNIEIPTKNWAAGTYILTISNGTKFWVHKIVKR